MPHSTRNAHPHSLVWGGAIFTSPYRERSYRIDIGRQDGELAATAAWSNKSSGYMSSPVVVGDHAYMHLGNSRVECIDLATGGSTWRSECRFSKYWSMVWRNGQIPALDSTGVFFLMTANPAFFELRDDLFGRELEAIAAWRWGDASTMAE